MALRALSLTRILSLSLSTLRLISRDGNDPSSKFLSIICGGQQTLELDRPAFNRFYHDGRPRGPLWRGKKLIGKEALFAILGLKRFMDDEEKTEKFIKTHVLRLLKMDMIAVLTELERQEEVDLALKVMY